MAGLRLHALHLLGGGYDIACTECLAQAQVERSMCDGVVSVAVIDVPGEPCAWCGQEQGDDETPTIGARPGLVQVGDV